MTESSGAPKLAAREKRGFDLLADQGASNKAAKTSPAKPSSGRPSVIVVGAGIVGLCVAWHLAKRGADVTMFDPNQAGTGCSSGNAGAFSPGSIIPLATPRTILSAPAMLFKPSSALHVPPRYWLKATPWLLRFVASATSKKVATASNALASLYRHSIDMHREILAEIGALDLIRLTGHLHLYRDESQLAKDEPDWQVRRTHGICVERLSRRDLEELEEGIAPAYQIGMFLPQHGMTVEPYRMATAIADELLQRQVRFVPQPALSLVPQGQRIIGIQAGGRVHRADHVVLAAGMWSKKLLETIGYRVPLESQRGYHIDLPDAGVRPMRPIIPADRKVFITPLDSKLRIAGTVELLGLDAPPTESRARLLLDDLAAVYPQARTQLREPTWMGHRPCLPDSLPVIGATKRWGGLWCSFGHGHLGLTGAAVTGDLIAGAILNRPLAIDLEPFSIDRFNSLGLS